MIPPLQPSALSIRSLLVVDDDDDRYFICGWPSLRRKTCGRAREESRLVTHGRNWRPWPFSVHSRSLLGTSVSSTCSRSPGSARRCARSPSMRARRVCPPTPLLLSRLFQQGGPLIRNQCRTIEMRAILFKTGMVGLVCVRIPAKSSTAYTDHQTGTSCG
ncbi:uncharacterized protein LAESUDRAFT_569529 [Laetiporus sulphureus 93-53]|uniref:Uncharacterized protein n=1 Tax=Laetiporus sulphureus 93-53 TaxID=1314785 RepID=A0A165FID3_9APHY|nr:uncharacterized protein LAESUDRAFT_569529 [Laetiporus sulphureus 93-53]KZT09016.1 hypothetical protein LAESUDRAFT_569529 [Laetiporus sulphureus 93-53]